MAIARPRKVNIAGAPARRIEPHGHQLARVRFPGARELQRHLHLVDRSGYLFVPDESGRLSAGRPTVLEVAFDQTEYQCLLHGHARLREDGIFRGAWVEVPKPALAPQLTRLFLTPPRRAIRLATDLMVKVKRPQPSTFVYRLLDVSLSGARLGCARGIGQPGDPIELRLLGQLTGFPTELGRAVIRWVDGSEAGVELVRETPWERTAATRLFEKVQEQWNGAPAGTHPIGCRCLLGEPLEPTLPRAVRWNGLSS